MTRAFSGCLSAGAATASFLATLTLCGCADVGEVTVLTVDAQSYVSGATGSQQRALVEVYDIRQTARRERTALDVSLGNIRFEPPEEQIVRELVQAKVDRLLGQRAAPETPPNILCGIRVFDATTPSTMLYWDMIVEIELVLRAGDKERTARGRAAGRTYAWPTKERLARVTGMAMTVLSDNLDVALNEILAVPLNE
ncbi:MAG: hypothetical protein OEY74_11675 [Gammaproteobacteria bacterium]|nr:hypothetical protein [Gammaproteobacteria bacterium]